MKPLITSVQNPRVKEAAKLRDRRQREKQGRIIIDGAREIERALKSCVELTEAFVCDGFCYADQHAVISDELRQANVAVFPCAADVFAKLAFGDRTDGIVAVATTPRWLLGELKLEKPATVAVLAGLEKPGNVGAVLRSADAAGISAVIIADGRTDLYNPNCIRASLGTIFAMRVCEASTAETLAWLRRGGFKMFAARVDGGIAYTKADLRGNAAIVLGSEADGLPKAWQGDDIQPIQLPMLGMADSLNVAATAAILFYEALRQRPR